MTSEDRHGIRPQPPNTCPMIDALIKELGKIEREIRRFDRTEDVQELKNMLDFVSSTLYGWGGGFEDDLEKIRNNTSAIRSWGQEWKSLALKQEEELDNVPHLE